MGSVFSEIANKKDPLRAPKKSIDRLRVANAFLEAFEELGGVPRLVAWGDVNPTEFYKILSKLIPQSNVLDIAGKLQHYIVPALPPSPLDDMPEHMIEKKNG